jgi:protein-disulfide isomerase
MKAWTILTSLFVLGALAACSPKSEAPPAPAPATAAQAPAAPVDEPLAVPLEPELVARLIREHSPVVGPVNAPVTIVEFLDPACEGCAAYAPIVRQIQFLYPTEVRVVVRFAAFHPGSDEAVALLDGARKQGKFETALEALFEHQQEWASHHAPDVGKAWDIAGRAGVDTAAARRHAKSPAAQAVLQQDHEDVVALQVTQTPTFFVNGKRLVKFGANELRTLVKQELDASAKSPS